MDECRAVAFVAQVHALVAGLRITCREFASQILRHTESSQVVTLVGWCGHHFTKRYRDADGHVVFV